MPMENEFEKVGWIDLSIAAVRVIKRKGIQLDLGKKILLHDNPPRGSDYSYELIVTTENDPVFQPATYRERAMEKGFYIGHHFGHPVKLKQMGEGVVYLHSDDVETIIWSYLIKYWLTIAAHRMKCLHFKAGCFEHSGRAYLLLGRGGSGKTEILNRLGSFDGYSVVANTHVLISSGKALGVKTMARVRKDDGTERYALLNDAMGGKWLKIGAVLWINHRTDGKSKIYPMQEDEIERNIAYYSNAIGNWELKEDISDYTNGSPFAFSRWIEQEDRQIHALCSKTPAYYLNLDVKAGFGLDTLFKLIDSLEKEAKDGL